MRRLSRRELGNLYAAAIEQRDNARIELSASRSICRAQAVELERLRGELAAALRNGTPAALAQAKRTISSLDKQLRVLEASNLELSRTAMERAGTAVTA